uniref:Uncharacterized protein n=1 Tax=Rhizophora mucronata TaxID=61149 RepID=A0A2P2QTB8_RHIMU
MCVFFPLLVLEL